MNDPNSGLPPKTSKFFDIIPTSKTSPTPTSRPLIVNSPIQSDSMIAPEHPVSHNAAPVAETETPEGKPAEETLAVDAEMTTTALDDVPSSLKSEEASPEPEAQPPASENQVEETLPASTPDQTPIEKSSDNQPPSPLISSPMEDELLLPAHSTPDEVTDSTAGVVIADVNTPSRLSRKRMWLIFGIVVVIIIVAVLLYEFVFKSSNTNIPQY